MNLFSNVNYHLSSSLGLDDQKALAKLLDANGAVQVSLQEATHIITDSLEFEGWQSVSEHVAIVTTKWVERSTVLGKSQPTKFYSADPTMLFSGVVACATDVIPADVEILSGAICTFGGQWRGGLTRDVTHLFALTNTSEKYKTAMHYQKDTRVKVLVPHWFDDVVRLGDANLSTAEYEWPEPKALAPSSSLASESKRTRRPTENQASLFKSVIFGGSAEMKTPDILGPQAQKVNIWNGKRVLLSKSLESSQGRLDAITAGIERCGGVVVDPADDEGAIIEQVDVLITRYRSGAAYIKALKSKDKLVGSLAWLFHVHTLQTITPPTDQLLHYPIPETKIPGFDGHEITVTNYTGDAREYLKRLIETMGGTFTPSMSPRNTVVIAAFTSGSKTDRAQHWSIPIVNHTWLEDCFVRWKNITVGVEKYIKFPPGVDFSTLLGDKGIGRKVLLDDAELEIPDDDVEMVPPPPPPPVETADEVQVDGDVVMTNDPAPEDAAVEAEPEDEGMESSSLPPPPPKLVRRLTTKPSLTPGLTDDSGPYVKPKATPKKSITRAPEGAFDFTPKKATPKKVTPKKAREPTPESSESEDFPTRITSAKVTRTRSSATKPKSKAKAKEREESEPGEELQAVSPVPRTRSATKPKSKAKSKAQEDSDSANEETASPTRAHKPKSKAPKSPAPAPRRRSLRTSPIKPAPKPQVDTEPEPEESSTEEEQPAPRTRRSATVAAVTSTPQRPKLKPIAKTPTMSALETGSQGALGRSPQRMVSVVVPSRPSYMSPSGSVRKEGSVSVRADAAPSRKTGPPRKKRRVSEVRAADADVTMRGEDTPPVAGPSKQPNPEPEMEALSGRSRRSAASKASQKLRDVIMPDVMNFAKEMRSGAVVNEWEIKGAGKAKEGGSKSLKRLSTAADDDDGPERKKAKVVKAKKGAGKKKDASEDEDEEDEPQKGSKRTKTQANDEDGDEERGGSKKVGKRKGKPLSDDEGATNTSDIRLMTTKVQLSDDVIKNLSKLGVKITTKPSDCTHLIAMDFGRTEKVLSAIAVSPYLLREEWAVKSAQKKRLLPEEDFLLADTKTETKYDFSMAESLERAKKNGGKLLQGATFYVTPKVDIDRTLLKNVIVAHGGQLSQQAPTVRILKGKENRYAISCKEDSSIWRPLAEAGLAVYSKELILTGVLRQKMDYEDEVYRVAGSY